MCVYMSYDSLLAVLMNMARIFSGIEAQYRGSWLNVARLCLLLYRGFTEERSQARAVEKSLFSVHHIALSNCWVIFLFVCLTCFVGFDYSLAVSAKIASSAC